MNYYLAEAARLGIKGTKVRDIVEAAIDEPSHARLRLAGACLAATQTKFAKVGEEVELIFDLQAILLVEREALWREGVTL